MQMVSEMAELIHDDDDVLQPSFNVDDLLRDVDFASDTHLIPNGYANHSDNIWSSAQPAMDFFSLNTNGYQMPESSHWCNFSRDSILDAMVNGDLTSLSQPGSDADSEYNNWRFDLANGVAVNQAVNEGLNVYTDTRHQWQTEPNMYDPFKSGSVIPDLDGVQFSLSNGIDKTPLKRSQSANSRPTFADIAKKPSSPGSEPPSTPVLTKDGPAYDSQESLASLQGKKIKLKAFRPAHARHGGYHVPLPIQPDSKYGLDEFEVPDTCGKLERSFSCNDAIDTSSGVENLDSSEDVEPDSFSSEEANVSSERSSTKKNDWFDPKRIFQNGEARTRSESEPCEPVLNNNFARTTNAAKVNSRRSNASYINNLHDGSHRSSKQTNTDRASKPAVNGVSGVGSMQSSMTDTGDIKCNGSTLTSAGPVKGDILVSTLNLGKLISVQAFHYLLLTLIFVVGIIGQVLYFFLQHICTAVTCTFRYLAIKVGLNSGSPKDSNFNSFAEKSLKIGLHENIKLPETSEEAMKRLLTCQHKDSYSILGLCSDATDEDIKRYYRRQAVLVHPDKNQHPGAEEAFKILGQAFELIGTPEKRQIYDKKIREEKLSEEVILQFNDLLTKFQEKMEEAANWIQCNNCGDKHRRYLTGKPVNNARKCNRCQCYHAAKEGDIWAETTFMGFKWHFYACMENRIYDVTPWVSCQPSMVDKFQPNSHQVRLKMGLSSSNGKTSTKHSSSLPREAELENLLKNLFPNHHTPGTSPTDFPRQGADNSKANSNSGTNRKGKRRVRRR